MFSDFIILIIVFIFILIILCKAYLIHNMYLFKDGPNDKTYLIDGTNISYLGFPRSA